MRFDPALVHFRLVHSSQREARPGQECVRGTQAFRVRASLVEGDLRFGQSGFQIALHGEILGAFQVRRSEARRELQNLVDQLFRQE